MADEVSQMKNGSARPPIGSAKLRQQLENLDSIVVCPGVYDGFTARLALKAGFECLYMASLTRISVHVLQFIVWSRRVLEPQCHDLACLTWASLP